MESHRHYYANYLILLQEVFVRLLVWDNRTMLKECQKNKQQQKNPQT